MSADIVELSRVWFEEVWNKGRAEVIDEMLAPDSLAHGLGEGGGCVSGREAFKSYHAALRATLSDIEVTIEDVLRDGDRTAIRYTCRATHSGDGLGVPGTGRSVTFTGMTISRWQDDKIVEGWNNLDMASLFRQIGVL